MADLGPQKNLGLRAGRIYMLYGMCVARKGIASSPKEVREQDWEPVMEIMKPTEET